MIRSGLVLLLLALPRLAGAIAEPLAEDDDDMKEANLFSLEELRGGLTTPSGSTLDIPPGQEAQAMYSTIERINGDITALTPAFTRIQGLKNSYPSLMDLTAAEAERAEVRKGMLPRRREFERRVFLLDRIKRIRILNGIDDSKAKEHNRTLLDTFRFAQSVGREGGEGREFMFRLRSALADEEKAFQSRKQALQDERAQVRAARRAAAAGGGGLLLLGGAAGWLLLRRRRGGALAGLPGPGDVVGRNYRLERELGRGGMGIVFEATDTSLRRKVAIKRLRPELKQSPRDLEAFLAEARLVATLKHPNIVEIYAIVDEGSDLHLVFELVAGRPLHLELQRAGRVPLPAVVALARQVGAALDYAHASRVIHRDLKPANIMVTPQGTAKVMDFGLAHRATQTIARLTQAAAWGTPPYMAPEQELGEVSARSDLYSLGVLLYEALTGKRPFPGPNYLAQKREQPPMPPSQAAPGLPRGVDAVLARALDPDPGKRFGSCAELVAALESAA